MRIEIDQSEKIENTSQDTVISFSNGKFCSIIIKAKEKRKVQKFFREVNKPKIFVYKLFAILIFVVIKKHIKEIDQMIIDLEYPGKDLIIKKFLLKEIRKFAPEYSKDNIIFKCIGKKSRAHFAAYGVSSGKKRADIEVTAKEIFKIIAN